MRATRQWNKYKIGGCTDAHVKVYNIFFKMQLMEPHALDLSFVTV